MQPFTLPIAFHVAIAVAFAITIAVAIAVPVAFPDTITVAFPPDKIFQTRIYFCPVAFPDTITITFHPLTKKFKLIQADRGCAAGTFFLWGGEGAFGQKRL
jgi:hypothetical protein